MIETPLDILSQQASRDAARSFIAWRKAIKSPLTERAAIMVLNTLREIVAQGGDADRALDVAQERGWRTIKVEWYWNNERANGQSLRIINGGRNEPTKPHPQLDAIALAARMRRT